MILSLISFLSVTEAEPSIIVTASREPIDPPGAPASVTVMEHEAIERLGLPAVSDFLKMAPGVSVSTAGPRGTQTQVRIRGAEANHTLLFVDGIRFNDPAAGNEARFEMLSADPASQIEIVRGPQSALWGSEALGGVVAIETADPLRNGGLAALGENGSLATRRIFGRYAFTRANVGLSAAGGWQKSRGIDSFGSDGERDGFESLSLSIRGTFETGPLAGGVVGHWIEGKNEYDGTDPSTFRRADTDDLTRNRIGAVRAWTSLATGPWKLSGQASYLDSRNRNLLDDARLNATFGDRVGFGVQIARQIGTHRLILAYEHEDEGFRARDTAFSGATRQNRSRSLDAVVGEWRARWGEAIRTDVALRHDRFSEFADATTLRASLTVRPVDPLSLRLSWGEGIAQPTFYDLFGFFPGTFQGNPELKPERSRGWETALDWSGDHWSTGIAVHRSRLSREILDTFDPETFESSTVNATGRSTRRGLEAWLAVTPVIGAELRLAWDWLDSREPATEQGVTLRETRRPRHRASLLAYGESGRLGWGVGLAYVGSRIDTDFDLFPAQRVRLGDYLLASARLSFELRPGVDLFARIENGLDEKYQDVVGYNVAGRTVHAGLRVNLGN